MNKKIKIAIRIVNKINKLKTCKLTIQYLKYKAVKNVDIDTFHYLKETEKEINKRIVFLCNYIENKKVCPIF